MRPVASLSAAETHLLGQSILADDLEKAVLAHAWPEFDPTKMKKTLPRVRRMVAALVLKYGTAAAVHAAQYYREQRAAAGVAGRVTVKMAGPPLALEVAKAVDFAVHSVWGNYTPDDLAHALTNVTGATQKFALDMGRQTVIDTAQADRQARGWARVPSPGACSFCLLLASRGAVYKTDNNFPSHNACRCHTEAVFGAYEPTAQVRAAQALYDGIAKGDPATTRNNFRVALQAERDAGRI